MEVFYHIFLKISNHSADLV